MEYQGTPGADVINQAALNIPLGSVILAGDGNDTVYAAYALVSGGRGDDRIVSIGEGTTVVYWDSPTGVVVNLADGTVRDGFGAIDKLEGIKVVHGSAHDDSMTGSGADEFFHGGLGSNSYAGGGGYDTVSYFFVKSTDAGVVYDAAADSFTVTKRFPNGDIGVDILRGIAKVEFVGEGADNVAIYRSDYVGSFRSGYAPVTVAVPKLAGLSQFKTGDFNGDNKADFTIVTQVGTGTAPAPAFIFLGDGQGNFSDQTASVFASGSAMNAVGGGRTLVADFNNDGRSDVFQLNFGDDAPPFPGGQNSLYLSSPTGTLADLSATLPRTLELNHGGSTGDVNGDGFADVLLNTLDEGSLLLMNDGTGRFNLAQPGKLPRPLGQTTYGAYPESHTFSGIVDVNGDRRPDLILGTWDGTLGKHESTVLLNDGTGDFSRQPPIALPASGIGKEIVLDVEPIDLNGDGFADLMLSITNGGTHDVFYRTPYIQLLVNDGTGHFRDETAIRLPQSKSPDAGGWLMSLTPVDFNRDGAMDILAESAGGTVKSSVYLNDGKGNFALHWQSGPGERTAALDLQGDGMADLLSAGGNLRMVPLSNYLPNNHVYSANFGGEELLGSAGNDTFIPRDGRNVFDGAGGMDVARFAGARADYSVTGGAGGVTITGAAGTVAMTNIERAVFGDVSVAFDADGPAGQAYRLYQAAFDRKPDAAGFGFWLTQMERGARLQTVAGSLASSPEFLSLVGPAASGAQFVTAMYANVLHRIPDNDGMAFWLSILDRGVARGDVLASFGESPENQAQVIGAIQAGMEYVPYA